jgi:hypothetical protein
LYPKVDALLKLRLLTGPRAGRQLRVSDTKPVSIGRRKGRLRLHDSRVSKHHAEIYFANDVWILRDLDSANGTYVNRRRVEGLVELEPGDMVQMGRVLLKIVRCDGIGMDAQPFVNDDLTQSDFSRADHDRASRQADTNEDSNFDFSALDSDDATRPSESALDDEQVDLSNEHETTFDRSKGIPGNQIESPQLDETFETVDVDFGTSDDDDSFFADLGDLTAAGESIDGLSTEGALDDRDDDDEDDPFLTAGAEDGVEEDTSDQITLDDDLDSKPRNSGTTLLSTVSHDDLVSEDSSDSDAQVGESDSAAHDDEDDESPALVGLHLDHAPPLQPGKEEKKTQVEVESTDAADDEGDTLEPPRESEHAGVSDESEDFTSDESFSTEESTSEDRMDVAAVDASDDSDSDLDAATSTDDTSDNFDDFGDATNATAAEPDEHLDTDGDEASIGEASETDPTHRDLDEDAEAGSHDMGSRDEPVPTEVIDEDDAEAIASEDAPTTPLHSGNAEAEASDALEGEDALIAQIPAQDVDEAPDFDIDAAFDALSEGLDDTGAAPAIADDTADDPSPAEDPVHQNVEAVPTLPDTQSGPLVGSQLDVDFIQDALSKLEGDEPTKDLTSKPGAEARLAAEESSHKGSAEPPSSEPFLNTPPPGLNPSTVYPPPQPGSEHAAQERKAGLGKWFLSMLLVASLVGVGGWYIGKNFGSQVTGRETANTTTPTGDVTPPSIPEADAPVAPPPAENEEPAPIVDGTDAVQERVAKGTPTGPNPFSAGPGVIGADVLEGITRDGSEPRPLDPPQQPGIPSPRPAPIVTPEPVAGPDLSPDGDGPDIAAEDTGSTPADRDVAPPVIDEPPARIVFLVDASGSLVDSLPQMLVWLNEALQTIEEDERFAIYFFKNGEPIAIKPEGLQSPTRDVLNRIGEEWLSPDRVPFLPSGRSNPTEAIAKALTLEPTDIYLLSDDAFAMKQGDTTGSEALALVKQALGDSTARVHGVQFFYRSDDSVLETLANQTKGTFEFVRERVVPDADPIDLLEELGGE